MERVRCAKMPRMKPVIWTVAGTDPGGGAGIQADVKVINALGGHACSVVTAIVAQDTTGVHAVEFPSEGIVAAQLRCLREDLPPAAVKTGMLGRASTVRALAATLEGLDAPLVCDPVLASSGGFDLLDAEGLREFRLRLLPRISVLAPNYREAAMLAGRPVSSEADAAGVAEALRALGAKAVVVKGGHGGGALRHDCFVDGARTLWISGPAFDVRHTHGTGCTHASALATFLAHGIDAADAAILARAYVNQGLRLGEDIGRGRGPLAHLGWPRALEDQPWASSTLEDALRVPGDAERVRQAGELMERVGRRLAGD